MVRLLLNGVKSLSRYFYVCIVEHNYLRKKSLVSSSRQLKSLNPEPVVMSKGSDFLYKFLSFFFFSARKENYRMVEQTLLIISLVCWQLLKDTCAPERCVDFECCSVQFFSSFVYFVIIYFNVLSILLRFILFFLNSLKCSLFLP